VPQTQLHVVRQSMASGLVMAVASNLQKAPLASHQSVRAVSPQ